MEKQFTLADGLKIQQQQLNQWKSIMKASIYDKLLLYVIIMNRNCANDETGYNVFRGEDIDGFVHNNLMKR